MAGEKTEKATPKKLDDARKKGQVGRSADLTGAVVLVAGLFSLAALAPGIVNSLGESMRSFLVLTATPDVVSDQDIGELLTDASMTTLKAVLPVAMACVVAAVLINVMQVGFKPSPEALKPQLSRMNPISGAKNLFGPHAIFETFKNIAKIAVVGSIAALAVFPKLEELAALVGMSPAVLLPELAVLSFDIIKRAAAAYFVIAVADFIYQKWRFAKSQRMDMQEVKDEFKTQGLPQEVKSQQRRRAMQLANARMMDDVPTADVVVTNPTHFSVALKYDADNLAPIVVAKGADHMAFKIRTAAREAGVTVVPDPPLARALYASVEIGQMIPEELFHAVAQLLAYVYRVARRTVAA